MASCYLEEHVGLTLVPPLLARGHDVLTTRQAGNHGLTDPCQLFFARHHGLSMITVNDVDCSMLHETLVLWAALGTPTGDPFHAGIALLPSSCRVAPARLVAALDEMTHFAADLANRCFGWVAATGWEEVGVRPFTP